MEKTQFTSLKPAFLHYWVMKLRFGFPHQPVALEQEVFFHLPHAAFSEASPPRRLPKVLRAQKVEVEPALSAAGFSGASSLSSSNIIILRSTAAIFHDILNKKIVRISNIVLTVNVTNTGMKAMTDNYKKIQLMSMPHALLI